MKAHKILLTDYALPHLPPVEGKPPMYRCRDSLAELCFVRELRLNGVALLKAQAVAQAILDAGDSVLLSDEQYALLNRACDVHEGFTRHDVELVNRVREAEIVEVTA